MSTAHAKALWQAEIGRFQQLQGSQWGWNRASREEGGESGGHRSQGTFQAIDRAVDFLLNEKGAIGGF